MIPLYGIITENCKDFSTFHEFSFHNKFTQSSCLEIWLEIVRFVLRQDLLGRGGRCFFAYV